VETGASQSVLSDVDVVLYDTFAQIQGKGIDLEDFVRDSGAKVVVYSWNLHPEMIAQAIAGGARGLPGLSSQAGEPDLPLPFPA